MTPRQILFLRVMAVALALGLAYWIVDGMLLFFAERGVENVRDIPSLTQIIGALLVPASRYHWWVRVYVLAAYVAGGSFVLLSINKQRAVRQEVEIINQRLERAQQVARMGSWEWNFELDRMTWSNELYSLWGVNQEEFVPNQDSIMALIHPDDREVNSRMLALADSDANSLEWRFRIIRPDGELRYIYQTLEVSRDEEKNPLTFFGIMLDVTDQEHAQLALRESQHRYQSLFEDSPISLWEEDYSAVKQKIEEMKAAGILNLRQYYIDHPRELRELAKLKIFNDINQATVELYHGSDKESALKALANTYTSQSLLGFLNEVCAFEEGISSYASEAPHLTLDGQEIFVSYETTLAPGYEDTWGRVIASIVDITGRKQMEDQIRENEALLRVILDTDPNMIYVRDERGVYILMNKALAESMDGEPDDFIGMTDLDMAAVGRVHPDEAALYFDHNRQVIESQQMMILERDKFTSPGGREYWYHTILVPLNISGHAPMTLGVSVDMTDIIVSAQRVEQLNETLEERVQERTRALEAASGDLALVKNRMETILQNSPDGFLLLNAAGKIVLANAGFSQLFNCPLERVFEHGIESFLPTDEVEAMQAAMSAAAANGKTVTHVFQVERFDHQVQGELQFYCEAAFVPIFEALSQAGMVINLRDVSPAMEVQRMKDAFVSNVSHELRTPITNFICNLELMRIRPENSPLYLDRLDKEVAHLRDLIEDLLHLSRLDQGAVALTKSLVDLRKLCGAFVDLRGSLAAAHGLSLLFEPGPETRLVFADEGLLTQVLSIFLTNAINYTPEGGSITVSLPRVVHPDGAVECGIAVQDTGLGVSPEDQARITQRFYRGAVGVESGVAGTGLGLSIAVEILSKHGGRLEIVSSGIPGEGSTFIAWLPQGQES